MKSPLSRRCESIQSEVSTATASNARLKTSTAHTNVFGDSEEFLKIAKTCHGSRMLQEELMRLRETGNELYVLCITLLEISTRQIKSLVRLIVAGGYVQDLVTDKFANYFIQTLLGNIQETSLNSLVDSITGSSESFAQLCTHQYASHVVQTAINMSGGNIQCSSKLAKCLCDNVVPIGTHFLGSICLIHAIDSLALSASLTPTFSTHWQPLSLSRHGHVVMMHALDRYDDNFLQIVADRTLDSLEYFISDDFGYRVLIHLLNQIQVRGLSRMSIIPKLVGLIKFNAQYFRLIEYLVVNFSKNEQVKHKLIPAIVRIVQDGAVTAHMGN